MAQTKEGAEKTAREAVSASGWIIDSLTESEPISRETYAEDAPHLAYYKQACIDGTVLVINAWDAETEG